MRRFNLTLVGACVTAALAISACATQDATSAVAEARPVAPIVTKTAPVRAKAETSAVAETSDKADPNRRICKRQSVPGSNMKKRVCASAAQWAAEAKKAREFSDGIQKGNRVNAGGN